MSSAARPDTRNVQERMQASLGRRHRRERLFRAGGLAATLVGLAFLGIFFATLIARGASAFTQTHIRLDIPPEVYLEAARAAEDGGLVDFDAIVRDTLRREFPGATARAERRALMRLVSIDAAFQVRDEFREFDENAAAGVRAVWVPAAATVDMYVKGRIDAGVDEGLRQLSDAQIGRIEALRDAGKLRRQFNAALFTNGDSREPELAGIRAALAGSLYMLLVTVVTAFPLGVAAAVYLEEFAPKNRWSDLIEVNINNLAAVPSIVFGLLGLAVFIDWLSLPRSASLVGGLVLALLTLPVIIISARAAIGAVPPSIREAATALGASRMQVVADHVLPLAMPGVLTGTIIGMSRALGETAPLLMIGMVAFIVDVPDGPMDPATALPVQIYLWADSPERAFAERTAAAIIVLLAFLLVMNVGAVLLRKRMERRL